MSHLLVVQGSARLDQVLGVSIGLFSHLQQPCSLDQWFQCFNSAPCVHFSVPQPLLKLTYVVAVSCDKRLQGYFPLLLQGYLLGYLL